MTSTRTELTSTRRPGATTLAVVGAALAAVVIVAGNYHVPAGESGGTGPGIATGVICAVVAALLFGLVVPRARNADRAALALGIVTLLSLAVFWSGVTPILAAATLAAASKTDEPVRRTTVFRWLVIAATVATLAWTLANSHLG